MSGASKSAEKTSIQRNLTRLTKGQSDATYCFVRFFKTESEPKTLTPKQSNSKNSHMH